MSTLIPIWVIEVLRVCDSTCVMTVAHFWCLEHDLAGVWVGAGG